MTDACDLCMSVIVHETIPDFVTVHNQRGAFDKGRLPLELLTVTKKA